MENRSKTIRRTSVIGIFGNAFLSAAKIVVGIISGSFVVETIFQIPGMGREFVSSAFDRDYTLVLGTVILYALLITAANLLVDIVQVVLNPRLRFEDS